MATRIRTTETTEGLGMGKDPAFLFYPSDWLEGTMLLNIEEKGAYHHLLCLQFSFGKLTEIQIKKALGESFQRTWVAIKDKFQTDGNYYWNVRLEEEKSKRSKYTAGRCKNLMGSHMGSHTEDEDENRNEDIIESKDGFVIPKKLDTPEFIESFNEFIQYRKKIKKTLSDISAKKQLKKLSEFSVEDAIKMIDQTIANGWQGIFEVKDGNNRNSNQSDSKKGWKPDYSKYPTLKHLSKT
jgi:hypothetical protein